METDDKSKEIRINVKVDEVLKGKLAQVSQRTRLSESTIVREAVQEKLNQLELTHPAYVGSSLAPEVSA